MTKRSSPAGHDLLVAEAGAVQALVVADRRILDRRSRKYDNNKSPAGKTDYHTMGACHDVLAVLRGQIRVLSTPFTAIWHSRRRWNVPGSSPCCAA